MQAMSWQNTIQTPLMWNSQNLGQVAAADAWRCLAHS